MYEEKINAYFDAPERRAELVEAISRLVKNKTVLIIAHRMRTVANADKIIVLKDGQVVESGSAEYLKKQKGIFAKMIERQITSIN